MSKNKNPAKAEEVNTDLTEGANPSYPLSYKSVRDYYINGEVICLYYEFMDFIYNSELCNKIFYLGFPPLFLWDLYIELCVAWDNGDFGPNYKHVDKWINRLGMEEENETLKEIFQEGGGYNDLEVIDNFFVAPLFWKSQEEMK